MASDAIDYECGRELSISGPNFQKAYHGKMKVGPQERRTQLPGLEQKLALVFGR
jgi:hypothetical protein